MGQDGIKWEINLFLWALRRHLRSIRSDDPGIPSHFCALLPGGPA